MSPCYVCYAFKNTAYSREFRMIPYETEIRIPSKNGRCEPFRYFTQQSVITADVNGRGCQFNPPQRTRYVWARAGWRDLVNTIMDLRVPLKVGIS
jgi:hypothetical protein